MNTIPIHKPQDSSSVFFREVWIPKPPAVKIHSFYQVTGIVFAVLLLIMILMIQRKK